MDLERIKKLAGMDLLLESLDPGQLFPIATVTRAQIANMLNNAIDRENADIPRFTGNDSRLTNKICNRFASHMEKWFEGFEEEWMRGGTEALSNIAVVFLKEIGHSSLRETPKKRVKSEERKK